MNRTCTSRIDWNPPQSFFSLSQLFRTIDVRHYCLASRLIHSSSLSFFYLFISRIVWVFILCQLRVNLLSKLLINMKYGIVIVFNILFFFFFRLFYISIEIAKTTEFIYSYFPLRHSTQKRVIKKNMNNYMESRRKNEIANSVQSSSHSYANFRLNPSEIRDPRRNPFTIKLRCYYWKDFFGVCLRAQIRHMSN